MTALLIPVSGLARPYLPGRPARLPSHVERQIDVVCLRSLADRQPQYLRFLPDLAWGQRTGSRPFSPSVHASLPLTLTLPRFVSHWREK